MRTDLHKNVCSSFIHNSRNGKDTKYPSTVEKITKLSYSYNGTLFSNQKETDSWNSMDEEAL